MSVSPSETQDSFQPLLDNLPDYFNSSDLSDGIINCDGAEFRIHKIVLCTQSKYFARAFKGEWKEAANGVISLKEDNTSAVEAMLRFLYNFDYDASGCENDSTSPMVFNAKVYSIADKYNIPALKVLAKEKFDEAVITCWDMDEFPHAIAEVYRSTVFTDRGLQDIVVEAACKNFIELLEKETFYAVLENTVGFAADVAKLHISETKEKDRKIVTCPNCQKPWKFVPFPKVKYYCPHCGEGRSDWTKHMAK